MPKFIILIILFSIPSIRAMEVFIEPSIFVNIQDDASIKYDGDSGVLRSNDLSYALKFGLHFGHFEFGFENESYNYTAHLNNSSTGSYTKELQISYNSLFIGYEFIKHHFIYASLSSKPYASFDNKSFVEDHSVFGLEYSYHIKEWVSLNAKIETASELKQSGGAQEKLRFSDLLLIGFSFPLNARDVHN